MSQHPEDNIEMQLDLPERKSEEEIKEIQDKKNFYGEIQEKENVQGSTEADSTLRSQVVEEHKETAEEKNENAASLIKFKAPQNEKEKEKEKENKFSSTLTYFARVNYYNIF